jgi:hypothetical protein
MEAANGMSVWVPADQLESWQKAQDEIKAGTWKPDLELKAKLMAAFGKQTPDK